MTRRCIFSELKFPDKNRTRMDGVLATRIDTLTHFTPASHIAFNEINIYLKLFTQWNRRILKMEDEWNTKELVTGTVQY